MASGLVVRRLECPDVGVSHDRGRVHLVRCNRARAVVNPISGDPGRARSPEVQEEGIHVGGDQSVADIDVRRVGALVCYTQDVLPRSQCHIVAEADRGMYREVRNRDRRRGEDESVRRLVEQGILDEAGRRTNDVNLRGRPQSLKVEREREQLARVDRDQFADAGRRVAEVDVGVHDV